MLKTILIGVCTLAIISAVPQYISAREYATLGSGVWSIRITNPADSQSDIAVRAYFNPNQNPWSGDMFYIAAQGPQKDQPAKPDYIKPGQSTGWIDIGEYMSSKPTFYSSLDDYLSAVYLGVIGLPDNSALHLKVELARGTDMQIVRTVDFNESRPAYLGYNVWLSAGPKLPTLGLMIPVSTKSKYQIMTFEEAAQQQLDWLQATGITPQPIEHMWFISHQSPVNLKNPSRLEEMQAKIVHLLGHSNLTNYVTEIKDLDYLKSNGYYTNPAKLVHRDAEASKYAETLQKAGIADLVRLVNFGDEIDIQLKATPEQQDAAFVEYLKSRNFKPIDFISPENEPTAAGKPESEQWGYVHLGNPLTSQKPKLLYEAAVFRYELWTRELSEDTKTYQGLYGKETLTGANYSPHVSVWPDVRKWINVFRNKGMVMPWSEDWWWQVPEVSPQVYGMILGTLRHSADYYKAPACFYTIPDPGPGADHLLRMNYFALGNQVKVLDHFAVYHQAYGTCDYIEFAESKDKFAAIQRITSTVAKIDKRLYNARMRKAQTAILLSKANDVWNTENLLAKNTSNLYFADLNTDSHERKAIWLALRHSQIPVDILTDDDVCDGMLNGYKTVYLVGQELQDKAVPWLKKWIHGGGVLVSCGGGGLLNQYRESSPAMRVLYSLTEDSLTRSVRALAPSEDLPKMEPIDSVTVNHSGKQVLMPVLCYKHNMNTSKQENIAARFANGEPAVIENKIGRGKAVLLGFMPGVAYLRPAVTDRHGLAENYPANIREYIAHWAVDAGVSYHAVTSDPLVEATLQESREGAIVTLVNFRNSPLNNLLVYLPGLKNADHIRSLVHGDLKITATPKGPAVMLPIDQGDFLLVD